MSSGLKQVSWLAFFLICTPLLVLIYELNIVEINTHLGYQQYTFDPTFACFNIFLIILLGLIIPKSLIKPTESFLFFYLLLAIFPYLLFNSVRRNQINFSYLVEVALLLFPFLFCTFFLLLLQG